MKLNYLYEAGPFGSYKNAKSSNKDSLQKLAAEGIFDGECPLKSTFVIPKPFDSRVVPRVARMVAEAAMKSGVAQIQIPRVRRRVLC